LDKDGAISYKAIITGKAEKHNSKSPHNYTIVCGDFNHGWDTGKYQLKSWAVVENNWAAPPLIETCSIEAKTDILFTFCRKTRKKIFYLNFGMMGFHLIYFLFDISSSGGRLRGTPKSNRGYQKK